MSLTTNDLLKIEQLLNRKLDEKLDKKFKVELAPIKKSISDLQDIVIGIRDELDTEHEFRYKKVEENSKQIGKNRKKIQDHSKQILTIQSSLNLTST
ncbi:hypothetical protein ACFLY9_01510 [Patescibacteria group bacterium]